MFKSRRTLTSRSKRPRHLEGLGIPQKRKLDGSESGESRGSSKRSYSFVLKDIEVPCCLRRGLSRGSRARPPFCRNPNDRPRMFRIPSMLARLSRLRSSGTVLIDRASSLGRGIGTLMRLDDDDSDRAFDRRETFLTKRLDSCRPSLSMRNKMKQSNNSPTLTSRLRGLQGRDIASYKSSIS